VYTFPFSSANEREKRMVWDDGVSESPQGENDVPAEDAVIDSAEDAQNAADEAVNDAGQLIQTNMEKLGATKDGGTWQESAEKLAKASLELQNMFGGLKGKLTGAPAPRKEISPEELEARTEAIAGILLLVKNVKDVIDEFKGIFGDLSGEKEKDALSGSGMEAKNVQNPKAEADALMGDGSQATIDALTAKKTNLTNSINTTTDAAQLTALRAELQTVETELVAAQRKFDLLQEQKSREDLIKNGWESALKRSDVPADRRGIETVALGGDGNDLSITLHADAEIAALPELKDALKELNIRMEGTTIKVQLGGQWKTEIAKVLGVLAQMNDKGEIVAEK
jgi:hypothetical protein